MSWAAETSKPDERIRNKNNLILISYDRRFPRLKVVKKCRSNLATMGVPGSKGEHFVWPEEAVYLMETCCALVSEGSRHLTQYEGYRILQDKNIPWHRYIVYATLKRAGFVVVRPRLEVPQPSSLPMAGSSQPNDLRPLLDSFPSFINGSSLSLPKLHLVNRLVPMQLESQLQSHPSVLAITRKAERLKSCRPRHRPQLDRLSSTSKNWAEFKKRKTEMAQKGTWARGQTTNTQARSPPSSPLSFVDFDVYLPQRYTHSVATQPSFRVKCFDARNGPLDLVQLGSTGDSLLVAAVVEQGKTSFIRTSGESIDINRYLKEEEMK